MRLLFTMSSVLLVIGVSAARAQGAEPKSERPHLKVAAVRFGIQPERVIKTNTAKLPKEAYIAGPLKTTATLLDDGKTRVFVIALDWVKVPRNASLMLRRTIGAELGIPESQVIFFASHNHSDMSMIEAESGGFEWGLPPYEGPPAKLNEVGKELLDTLLQAAKTLPDKLQPVRVCWTVGTEDRITYNRKGRRADGSTFLMREEDRLLQGKDFRGDVDTQAPVVIFQNMEGQPVAAWVQFTGHPVTSFHPEKPVVFGDWPMVAADRLSEYLSKEAGYAVPVGFFQGCAGDVNSKGMFRGGVELATQFGEMLGQSYLDALSDLTCSERDGLDFEEGVAELPLAPLPSEEVLKAELEEIDDFIRRARAGDEETLECVGLNFPRDLSPAYRAGLVERIRHWSQWALDQRLKGKADELPKSLPVDFWVLRIGDVGLVGMPCEPFQGIGREMRAASRLPLTIPCGYTNFTMGYIPDSPNVGDQEYMSSFHRYSASPDKQIHPRPPLARPGGSVFATEAVKILNQMAGEQP